MNNWIPVLEALKHKYKELADKLDWSLDSIKGCAELGLIDIRYNDERCRMEIKESDLIAVIGFINNRYDCKKIELDQFAGKVYTEIIA